MDEVIEHLSAAWELLPGDLIFSGTPEGVTEVVRDEVFVGEVAGLPTLTVRGYESAADLRGQGVVRQLGKETPPAAFAWHPCSCRRSR
jgi:hypothetical protein